MSSKPCDSGPDCKAGSTAGEPAFTDDANSICDACLLFKYGLLFRATNDQLGDPLSLVNLYREDDVIKALRIAEHH